MDSTLSLREIQDRLRSGSSVEDVAVEAGVSPEQLAIYAAPIMAEREYISALARDANVRRSGDSPAHRDLEAVVTEELSARGADAQEVEWDAHRIERRRWHVVAEIRVDDTTRRAVFNYDVDGRYSVAANEDARWMLGELPLPPVDPEAEPTVELTEEQRRARLAAAEDLEEQWDEDSSPSDLQTLRAMMSDYEEAVSGYEDTVGLLRPRPTGTSSAGTDPAPGKAATSPGRRTRPEPEQPSLVEGQPPASRRRPTRKRAQVPSWDEIVFGSSGEDGRS